MGVPRPLLRSFSIMIGTSRVSERASSTKSLSAFFGIRLINVTPRFSSSVRTSCWRSTAFLASTIACTSFAFKTFFSTTFGGFAAFLTGAAFFATAFLIEGFFANAFLATVFLAGFAFFATNFFTGAVFLAAVFFVTLFLSTLNTATIILWFYQRCALMRWVYYNLFTGVNAHRKHLFYPLTRARAPL